MAHITNKKTIFFVTSPRTPSKMIDEIRVLVENFSGQKWSTDIQKEFYKKLSEQPFSSGSLTGDIALKARDRITRAPKSLGLVELKPVIMLSDAGEKYVYGKRPSEIFLRQLLKFQFPSPYHIDKEGTFNVKPYLELMRLISELGGLSKNEIALFAVQLTDFHNYDDIKRKILNFREAAKTLKDRQINYKSFVREAFEIELKSLFEDEISSNDITTRQSEDVSLKKFLSTKQANHLDYADAAIRYLRETGLFSINPRTFKVYVMAEKQKDLDFVLKNVPREAGVFKSEQKYGEYLFDAVSPRLLTDDKSDLIDKILDISSSVSVHELNNKDIEQLKDIYYSVIVEKTRRIIEKEKDKLRTYIEYPDIIQTFSDIAKKEIADPPLFLEWNIWRSFTMLNDGDIVGNFRIDDDGTPLSTALGNMPDIICKYKDFEIIVEVTMSSGHKQYEMEGEPVARHYGDHKRKTTKELYCIFIAPKLNASTIAYYYSLYRTNISYYGGQAKIIPLELADFILILDCARKREIKPSASDFRELFSKFAGLAMTSATEVEWYKNIREIIIDGAFQSSADSI